MIATKQNIRAGIKSLKTLHRKWAVFFDKTRGVLPILSSRLNCEAYPFRPTDDIAEEVTAEDFEAAGFSADEAAALIFVLTQECTGRAVVSIDDIDRWFEYCA